MSTYGARLSSQEERALTRPKSPSTVKGFTKSDYKESSVLRDQFERPVMETFANHQNIDKLKRQISRYIDMNNEKLMTTGPVYRTTFNDQDIRFIFDLTSINQNEMTRALRNAHDVYNGGQIMSKPFNTLIVLIIRHFSLMKSEEGSSTNMKRQMEAMVNLTLMYMTLSMYPSIHYNFFRYLPNEQTMNYTINGLSNKFKIKQYGNLYQTLVSTTTVCYETNLEKIHRGNDKDIVDFVLDLNTRLRSFVRKIANAFYENRDKGAFMNLDSDNLDEDNYHETDNNTFVVSRTTDKVMLRLVVDGADIDNINLAAGLCKVSRNELRNYVLRMILDNERQSQIRQIVESILFLFIFDSRNTADGIHDKKFLFYCMETYKKSNTTDANIIKIKDILDSWLEDLGVYKKTNRAATINDFRRAMYLFFVISIQTTM